MSVHVHYTFNSMYIYIQVRVQIIAKEIFQTAKEGAWGEEDGEGGCPPK